MGHFKTSEISGSHDECSLVEIDRCFRGAYCCHHRGALTNTKFHRLGMEDRKCMQVTSCVVQMKFPACEPQPTETCFVFMRPGDRHQRPAISMILETRASRDGSTLSGQLGTPTFTNQHRRSGLWVERAGFKTWYCPTGRHFQTYFDISKIRCRPRGAFLSSKRQ
jgi:hypothetical protein